MAGLPPNFMPPPELPPVQRRIKVVVEYIDEKTEEVEAEGALSQQGMFLIIPEACEVVTGINMGNIRKWRAVPQQITVARGMNVRGTN